MPATIDAPSLSRIVASNLRLRNAFTSCFLRGPGANTLAKALITDKTWRFKEGSGSLNDFLNAIIPKLREWVAELGADPERDKLERNIDELKSLDNITQELLIHILSILSKKRLVEIAILHFSQLTADTIRFLNKLFYTEDQAIHLLLADDTLKLETLHYHHDAFLKQHQYMVEHNLPNVVIISTEDNLGFFTELKFKTILPGFYNHHNSGDAYLKRGSIQKGELGSLHVSLQLWTVQGEHEKIDAACAILLKFYEQNPIKNSSIHANTLTELWIKRLKNNMGRNLAVVAKDAELYRNTETFKKTLPHIKINFFNALIELYGLSTQTNSVFPLIPEIQKILPKEFKVELKWKKQSNQPDEFIDTHLQGPFFLYTLNNSAKKLAGRLSDLHQKYEKYSNYLSSSSFEDYDINTVFDKIKIEARKNFSNYDRELIIIAIFHACEKFSKKLNLNLNEKLNLEVEKYFKQVNSSLELQFALIEFQSKIPVIAAAADKGFFAFIYIIRGLEYMLENKLLCSKLVDNLARVVILYQSALKQDVEKTRPLFNLIEELQKKYPDNVSLFYSYHYVIPLYRKLTEGDIGKLEQMVALAMQQGDVSMAGTLGQLVMHYDFAFSDDVQKRYEKKRQMISKIIPYFLNRRPYWYFLLSAICTMSHDEALLGIDDQETIIPESTLADMLAHVSENKEKNELCEKFKALFPELEATQDNFDEKIKKLSGYMKITYILYLENNMVGVFMGLVYQMLTYLVKQDVEKGIEAVQVFYNLKLDDLSVTMAVPIRVLMTMAISMLVALKYPNKQAIPEFLRNKLFQSSATKWTRQLLNHTLGAYVARLAPKYEAKRITQGQPELEIFSQASRSSSKYLSKGSESLIMTMDILLANIDTGKINNSLELAVTLMFARRLLQNKMLNLSAKKVKRIEQKNDKYALKAYELLSRANATMLVQRLVNEKPELDPAANEIESIKEYIVHGIPLPANLVEKLSDYIPSLEGLSLSYRKLTEVNDNRFPILEKTPMFNALERAIETYLSIQQTAGMAASTVVTRARKILLEDGFKQFLNINLSSILQNITSLATTDHLRIAVMINSDDEGWKTLWRNLKDEDKSELLPAGKHYLPLSMIDRTTPNTITSYSHPENLFTKDPYYNGSFLNPIAEKGVVIIRTFSSCIILFIDTPVTPTVSREPLFLSLMNVFLADIARCASSLKNIETSSRNSLDSSAESAVISVSSMTLDGDLTSSESLRLEFALQAIKRWAEEGVLLTQENQILTAALSIIEKYKNNTAIFVEWQKIMQTISDNQQKNCQGLNKYFPNQCPNQLNKSQKEGLLSLHTLIKRGLLTELDFIPAISLYLHNPVFKPPLELILFVEQKKFNEQASANFSSSMDVESWKPVTEFGQYSCNRKAHENLVFYLVVKYLELSAMKPDAMIISNKLTMVVDYFIIKNGGLLNINNISRIELVRKLQDSTPTIEALSSIMNQIETMIRTDLYIPFSRDRILLNNHLEQLTPTQTQPQSHQYKNPS